ncbi:Ail/Lom family outer membrane beta-barrel protein [Tatumella terrea]|uniref:Ail/Lom family outer membrane beta-barrel protein n=1 Tax=Tatumella terrea TaxID=419007 RepID=A0ABW1VWF8_9GAMM
MKVLLTASLLAACLGLSMPVLANEQTISLGYAHSKIQDAKGMNGVNIKYRYEWNSPLSVIGSFTYMTSKAEYSPTGSKDIIHNKADINYFSLSAGPAYRFNPLVSVYGLLGINVDRAKYSSSWLNYESGSYRDMGTEYGRRTKAAFMYGAGIQINPVNNVAIDIGYEGTSINDDYKTHAINGFNIGIGYRF